MLSIPRLGHCSPRISIQSPFSTSSIRSITQNPPTSLSRFSVLHAVTIPDPHARERNRCAFSFPSTYSLVG
ncbi:hypothetical protein BDZ91DRAFT_738800 [Kalaharituber pfeilii]|nr:hypothetical protein BDZ91DRAFT_738800 [Kalaharituber pfeilii]